MSERKPNRIVPIIVGTAVVVAGGIGTYLYLKGAFSDATSPLASAKVVPDEALMAGFVSTDPKNWAQLQQFGTPEAQKLVDKGLKDFNKEMLTESNINYEKDVKPWLGSVMFAVLPSPTVKPAQATPPKSSPEVRMLMVVGVKDKVSALSFANKLKAKKAGTKQIDYKGIKIEETTDKSGKTYTALLDSHLVMSDEKEAVQLAIDTFKGQPSFASKAGAASLLTKGVDVQNSIAQFYIPDYAGTVQQALANNPNTPALPPETLKQLKAVKSVVMGVGIDNAGVRMKAIAKVDPSVMKVQYKASPGKVASQLPAETIALIAGNGISQTWATVVEQSKADPQAQQGFDMARQQLKLVNLDLDKDIFGWMDGEFALAAIPSTKGILAPVGFGGALVFQTSDRKTAEATFNKLDAIAKGNSITVAPRKIQGKTVTEWQIPQQGAFLGHGWIDQNTMYVAIGGPIADIMANKPSQPLDNSTSFKTVTGSLQKPNAGYFYLDMDKTMSLVNRQLPPAQKSSITPETTAILNSMHGIGLTVTQPDASTGQVEVLLSLKPKTGK
ncbi:DUF3352 domain-containing protein [Coleofasciculus sp. FACHB-1120]|uniref:DUF3352 domain-containing protein n=1 Tax=Coleofasciculus sp. FACHB-1120 TaxID=2692783 RepID=UPI0016893403|nr:DUF3352 domain-containing protein [Coleofasciculus sp. FACHB-1120]MBD2743065.1 DUF3352 domain-containing protein [Coleofasciculus sp. FACHB-1120]